MRYRVRELSSAPYLPAKVCQFGAGVAQLVERQPSKLDVAGSNPVSRSIPSTERGRHVFELSWIGSVSVSTRDLIIGPVVVRYFLKWGDARCAS